MAGGNLYSPEEDAAILDAHRTRSGKNWLKELAVKLGRNAQSIGNRHSILAARASDKEASDVRAVYTSKPMSLVT
jgi:hypothetical protein